MGVVHEEKGVKEFQPYLNSAIYLDEEVTHCCSINTMMILS